MEYTERAEADFGQPALFVLEIHCVYCGREVSQPFYVVKHRGTTTTQLPFCSELEANEYYLDQLRLVGL